MVMGEWEANQLGLESSEDELLHGVLEVRRIAAYNFRFLFSAICSIEPNLNDGNEKPPV
jgi:hypothetical protein